MCCEHFVAVVESWNVRPAPTLEVGKLGRGLVRAGNGTRRGDNLESKCFPQRPPSFVPCASQAVTIEGLEPRRMPVQCSQCEKQHDC